MLIGGDKDEDVPLPINDWRHVDTLLYDLLKRGQAPLWTPSGRSTGGVLYDDKTNRPELEKILPDFQAMGGVVDFSCSVEC